MNPALSTLLLLAPMLLLGLVLGAPGLLEWLRPQDDMPLFIDRLYAKDDDIFADRFRQMASNWWSEPEPLGHGRVDLGAGMEVHRALLVESLTAAGGVLLTEEAWARRALSMGAGSQSRALVCDGGIHLGEGCEVERWVHGDGEVLLDPHCTVAARITSWERIWLGAGCRSRLIAAPTVSWEGPRRPLALEIPTHARRWLRRRQIPETGRTWDIPRFGLERGSTAFVTGDLILDAEADVDFPLVVRGNLYIRRGALIAGDIKAYGDLVVEGSTVVGNLCCGGRLVVGEGSWVQGCLRGDTLVWLGDEVVVGRPERAEAVVGERVILAGTGTVHGRITALAGWIEVVS